MTRKEVYEAKYAALDRLYFSFCKVYGMPDETDPQAVKDYIFRMIASSPKVFVHLEKDDVFSLDVLDD